MKCCRVRFKLLRLSSVFLPGGDSDMKPPEEVEHHSEQHLYERTNTILLLFLIENYYVLRICFCSILSES
jgi:hypothetical protein